MKKIILFTIVMSLILSSAYADQDYWNRTNCWRRISWRYKTFAAVKKTGFSWDKHVSTGCNSNLYDFKQGFYSSGGVAGLIYPKATSRSQAGPSVSGEAVGWIKPGWEYMFSVGSVADADISDLAFSPIYLSDETDEPIDSATDTTEGTFTKISSTDLVFDEGTQMLRLPILNGTIRVDSSDLANTYSTIKIFIYDATDKNDDDVENGDNGILLKTMQAIILNGKLYLDGFDSHDFIETSKYEFQINNVIKNFPIPNGIDVDDIIVRYGGDAGSLGNGIPLDYQIDMSAQTISDLKFQVKLTEKLGLNIYGNPTTNSLEFDITKGQNDYKTVKVQLYSSAGRLAKVIYSGDLSPILGVKQSVDISSLNPGVYLLNVTTNTGEKFIRKVIIR